MQRSQYPLITVFECFALKLQKRSAVHVNLSRLNASDALDASVTKAEKTRGDFIMV
jgi:hypothetical protein